MTTFSKHQVIVALRLALEKLEACRELANEAHTAGLEDLAASFLLEADTTRQAMAILASWLHAFLYANGKVKTPPREVHHVAADYYEAIRAVCRVPGPIAKQAY